MVTAATISRLRARVLVVDPDLLFLNTVSRWLLEAGHEPRRANSLAHGLEKTHGWVPDVVIVDRMLCMAQRRELDRLLDTTSAGSEGLIVTDTAEHPVGPLKLLGEVHRRLASLELADSRRDDAVTPSF